jgi:hypothetical protein
MQLARGEVLPQTATEMAIAARWASLPLAPFSKRSLPTADGASGCAMKQNTVATWSY